MHTRASACGLMATSEALGFTLGNGESLWQQDLDLLVLEEEGILQLLKAGNDSSLDKTF